MVYIGAKELSLPVLQGGMGVGISLGGLAGAVAACGGMGCISAAHPGYREDDFYENPLEANIRGLKKEIAKAREIAKGKGIIAVNVMVAMRHYAQLVRAAVEEGVDAIISGAGLPLNLPELTAGTKTMIAPIVSSARAAKLIMKTWEKRYQAAPDFMVIEGCGAGGHLGFHGDELENDTAQSLDEILPEVLQEIAPIEQQSTKKIPVFVGGGGLERKDLIHFRTLGAAGVQIATQLIATPECDASQGFKDVIIAGTDADVRVIHSPVGMPGRALNTPLIQRMHEQTRIAPTWCAGCIKSCDPAKTKYCITHALIAAASGNVDEGLFFCGAQVGKVNEMLSVAQRLEEFKI